MKKTMTPLPARLRFLRQAFDRDCYAVLHLRRRGAELIGASIRPPENEEWDADDAPAEWAALRSGKKAKPPERPDYLG